MPREATVPPGGGAVRSGSGFLNLMLAGAFILLGAQWFKEGSTGWAAFAGLAVAMNVLLAVLKFKDAKATSATGSEVGTDNVTEGGGIHDGEER